jgi:tRNA G18 (ribose-2'-O)-methylase SpoU
MTGGLSVTRWKAVRRLLHPRGREESGRLLVEGRRAVRGVLAGNLRPEYLLAGPAAAEQLGELSEWFDAGHVPVYGLTAAQVKQLSDTAHSQEVFAVLPWRPATAVPVVLPNLLLHLSGMRNPVNMGALLRTAAAFGIAVTCSPDCVDVTHPAAVRGGAASYFSIPLYVNVPLGELRARCPHQLVYASAAGGTDLSAWQWPERAILVLGGEAAGATESTEGAQAVHIPVRVESLNAAVAGGIIMWEAHRGMRT